MSNTSATFRWDLIRKGDRIQLRGHQVNEATCGVVLKVCGGLASVRMDNGQTYKIEKRALSDIIDET